MKKQEMNKKDIIVKEAVNVLGQGMVIPDKSITKPFFIDPDWNKLNFMESTIKFNETSPTEYQDMTEILMAKSSGAIPAFNVLLDNSSMQESVKHFLHRRVRESSFQIVYTRINYLINNAFANLIHAIMNKLAKAKIDDEYIVQVVNKLTFQLYKYTESASFTSPVQQTMQLLFSENECNFESDDDDIRSFYKVYFGAMIPTVNGLVADIVNAIYNIIYCIFAPIYTANQCDILLQILTPEFVSLRETILDIYQHLGYEIILYCQEYHIFGQYYRNDDGMDY